MLLRVAVVSICLSHFLLAGEYNPVLSIGDDSPVWKTLPGVDGKEHSLADLKDKHIVVVVFTCNSCPYAVDVEKRLIEFSKSYKEKSVELVAINVNKISKDNLDAMKTRAKERKFNFAYLYDDSQKIAKDFGATYTPEFFVLDKNRKIAYMGAMDDSPNGKKITKRFLEDAVHSVLQGDEVTNAETVAIGCRIRFERKRRTRQHRK